MEPRSSGVGEGNVLHGDVHEPIPLNYFSRYEALIPQLYSGPFIPEIYIVNYFQ